MVRITVVVWVMPPPVAVTVMVWLPTAALLPVVIVIVEPPEPGAAMELGEKVTVWAPPWPEDESEMAELKPPDPEVVMVTLPEERRERVMDDGEAETVKAGWTAAVTVREIVVDWVRPPPVPVTVIE
jgi:hypothetical protein